MAFAARRSTLFARQRRSGASRRRANPTDRYSAALTWSSVGGKLAKSSPRPLAEIFVGRRAEPRPGRRRPSSSPIRHFQPRLPAEFPARVSGRRCQRQRQINTSRSGNLASASADGEGDRGGGLRRPSRRPATETYARMIHPVRCLPPTPTPPRSRPRLRGTDLRRQAIVHQQRGGSPSFRQSRRHRTMAFEAPGQPATPMKKHQAAAPSAPSGMIHSHSTPAASTGRTSTPVRRLARGYITVAIDERSRRGDGSSTVGRLRRQSRDGRKAWSISGRLAA